MIEPRKKFTGAQMQRFLIGFASMAVVFIGMVALLPLVPKEHKREDIFPLIAAAMLLQMGVTMMIVHVMLPNDAPQRGQPVSQVLSFLTGSLTLLIPIFGPLWFSAEVLYGVFLVLFVVSYIANYLIWRGADELMRRMLAENSALSFHVVMAALLLYAVGERLGLMQGVSAWTFVGFASLMNIIAAFIVIWRRGQLKHPEE